VWSAGPWAESSLLTSDARRRLRELAVKRFEVLRHSVHFEQPHQEALLYDLLGRQRRWVASQPNLMSCFVVPVTFFCDDELIDFWTNVGVEDLLGQRLYLAYARSRFPRLFPEAEPKVRSRRGLVERIRRRLQSVLGGGTTRSRPSVVDKGRIVLQAKEQLLARFNSSAQVLEELLDIVRIRSVIEQFDARAASNQQVGLMLIQLANLLHLISLREGNATTSRTGAAS
jgi:hypothetical protein